MIDILYNKLGSSNGPTEWKDVAPSIFNRHSQYSPQEIEKKQVSQLSQPEPQQVVPANNKNTKTSVAKAAKTNKPLDILSGLCGLESFHTSIDHIKESIITLITKEEFSKVFGMTKCAEIMSGIVNNRWNKSTALFISFLLDKEVYYNDKVVIYNKEKNNGRITI